ncbi:MULTISPECIES: YdcH family protein [unclassified Acinetobacter]|uniref:YdcH family protein n=1 Tax=unclassified Acinetobacter TaxID=196816 RepID=UPI0035B901BD
MFPEHRELITQLKTEDRHFLRLFDKHNEIDQEIINLENDPVASVSRANDIEELKREKLALKDELGKILNEHAEKQA